MVDPFLEPGVLVRHPGQPDWGLGQVQSVIGHRVTVNFEESGKQTIDATRVRLVFVGDDPRGMMSMTENLADWGRALAKITEEAAVVILPFWRTELAVVQKADESPVTEADRAGERLILQRLAELYPDVTVISEEHASEFGTPDAVGSRFFLVDPVDGTKAFVRGDPNFTVNIGLIDNGVPVAGAVCAPATGEVWFTTAQGAVKRTGPDGAETPVHVRPWPKGEALGLVSHTMHEDKAAELAAHYGFDLRAPMDSSIKMCRIAEGSADIYPRHGPTSEWDTAAAHAVVVAAGGTFTQPDGSPFLYGKADQAFRNGWFVARGAPAA